MGKVEFEEFLKTVVKEKKERKIDWEKKKEEFLKAIDELYAFVEECLKPYKDKVNVSYKPVKIVEEKLGHYESQKMIIEIGDRIATLTPVGAIVIAASGRVDLEGEKGIIKLVRVPEKDSAPKIDVKISIGDEPADTRIPTREDSGKNVWKIATPPPGIRYIDLDCDSFFDALMKVIQ
jgi:hypothetical protein